MKSAIQTLQNRMTCQPLGSELFNGGDHDRQANSGLLHFPFRCLVKDVRSRLGSAYDDNETTLIGFFNPLEVRAEFLPNSFRPLCRELHLDEKQNSSEEHSKRVRSYLSDPWPQGKQPLRRDKRAQLQSILVGHRLALLVYDPPCEP